MLPECTTPTSAADALALRQQKARCVVHVRTPGHIVCTNSKEKGLLGAAIALFFRLEVCNILNAALFFISLQGYYW